MVEALRRKAKIYYFHSKWEQEFIFTLEKDKCILYVMPPNSSAEGKRKPGAAPQQQPPEIQGPLPTKKCYRAKKVEELKSALRAQQSLFVEPAVQHQAATEASYRISHLLAKHKKPFTDGELMKEAMTITTNTVFKDFKNKDDITAALSSVPLGPATVTRQVEALSEDVDRQVLRDMRQVHKLHS